MILTHELLHKLGRSGCGFNATQLRLLGVSEKPKRGWLSRLIGTEISEEAYEKVKQLQGIHPKDIRRLTAETGVPASAARVDAAALDFWADLATEDTASLLRYIDLPDGSVLRVHLKRFPKRPPPAGTRDR